MSYLNRKEQSETDWELLPLTSNYQTAKILNFEPMKRKPAGFDVYTTEVRRTAHYRDLRERIWSKR